MSKAVISTGSKQYLVTEGETFEVELLKDTGKTVSFKPLLVIKDQSVTIGKPIIDAGQVDAEIIESDKQAEKVVSIRYKAKKRVHTVRGHRQRHSVIKITKIA
jgi:large subunit ribosomal protein L21